MKTTCHLLPALLRKALHFTVAVGLAWSSTGLPAPAVLASGTTAASRDVALDLTSQHSLERPARPSRSANATGHRPAAALGAGEQESQPSAEKPASGDSALSQAEISLESADSFALVPPDRLSEEFIASAPLPLRQLNSVDCQANNLAIDSGESCFLAAGSYTYTSITVKNGGVLTLGGNVATGGVTLTVTSDMAIEPSGIVSADGQGYPVDGGPGVAPDPATMAEAGGSAHGGRGGIGYGGYAGGTPYGDPYQPTTLGSGGRWYYPYQSVSGGGAIHLIVGGTLTIDGTVSANGQSNRGDYTSAGGGGAGGSIWIEAEALSGDGLVQANGGNGGRTNTTYLYGGGGGGGRISINQPFDEDQVQAQGGHGHQYGGPGTIYWSYEDRLQIDNGGHDGAAAGLPSGDYTFDAIQLSQYGHLEILGASSIITLTASNVFTGDGTSSLAAFGTMVLPSAASVQAITLDIRNHLIGGDELSVGTAVGGLAAGLILRADAPAHEFDALTVQSTGAVTLVPFNNGNSTYTDDAPYVLRADTLTVEAGGKIASNGFGYVGTHGTGSGPGGGQTGSVSVIRGAGGGYGGQGGSTLVLGGPTYGTVASPDDLGSGGGGSYASNNGQPGGDGGGAIHLIVTGTLTVNGLISANGTTGGTASIAGVPVGAGGGSGGSIWIEAQTLTGSGKIVALGGPGGGPAYSYIGNGDYSYGGGGGGGGGRLGVYAQNYLYTGQFSVLGGPGANNGEPGTIDGLPQDLLAILTSTGPGASKDCPCNKPAGQVAKLEPINLLTGGLEYSASDLSFPALGGQLAFERSYASLATSLYTTTLGFGWTHNLDSRLILPGQPGGVDGKVLFKAHSASQYTFFDNGDGRYQPYPGVNASLTTSGSAYTLIMDTQTTYVFDLQGRMQSWINAAGHTWTYTYDGNQRLYRVTAGARYLQLEYDANGRLQTVRDHTDRTVSFGYDGNGDLASVIDVSGNTWTYRYDGTTHRLAEVIDPTGRTVERTEYDAQGRAVRQYNGLDELTGEITYDGDGTATLTDGLDRETTAAFTARNVVAGETNDDGETVGKTFDHNFQMSSVTDEAGRTTAYQWSESGAVLNAVTDALTNTTLYAYDSRNNPTVITDARGFTATYTYTGSLLTASTDALGNTTRYTYTTSAPLNVLQAMSDPLGNTTTYTYNAFGQVLTMTDASGIVTAYGYDDLGRLITTTVAVGTAAERVTRNEYNPAGQVLTTTRNYLAGEAQNYQGLFNLVTTYQYDEAGRLVSTEDTLGRADWTCYDADGRVARTVSNASGDGSTPETDPCDAENYEPSADPAYDRISRTVYDGSGHVIATIDPAGKIMRTYYDNLYRPVFVVDNLYGQAITVTTAPAYDPDFPDRNIRAETVYDEVGNAVQTISNAGQVTHTCYDALNRPVKTILNPTVSDPCADYTPSPQPDRDVIQRTVYDENGNVIAAIDAAGRVTRTYYDPLNRPEVVIQNLAGQPITTTVPPAHDLDFPDQNIGTQTFYDAAGRAYRTLDLTTTRSNWTCYDEGGRLTLQVQNATGDPCSGSFTPSSAADEDLLTEFVYDAAGRQIATLAPDGQVTRTYFDADGRRSAEVANLVGQAITVDTLPTDFSEPDENVLTLWGYDVLGRVMTTTVAAGRPEARTAWTCYDALGRAVKTVQNPTVGDPCSDYTPSGQPDQDVIQRTIYDAAGNAIAQFDAAGRITRTYYDALNRPTVVVQNWVGQEITDPTPPAYSAANPDRNVRTTTRYDAAGRTLEMVDNAGMVTRTDYDQLGRVVTTTVNFVAGGPVDAETNLTEVAVFDKLGNTLQQIDADGVVTAFEYDDLNRAVLVRENHRPGYAENQDTNVRTEYTYDSRGNRRTVEDGNRNVTTFDYDDLGRPISQTDALTRTATYGYNKVGLQVSVTDANGATTTYGHDGLRRLESINYPSGTADVTFTYDALGNRRTMVDGIGTTTWDYDQLSRPITITDPFTGTVGYGYDRLGNRTSLIYPDGRAVAYDYNALNQLVEVTDWDEQVTGYVYNAVGQVVTTTLPNGVITVNAYNAAHRLTGISHATAGETLASYTYTLDRVGNRVQAVESVRQPATATPAPSATPSPTITTTPTATATATATATPTDTATATPSASSTPTATETPTPSATSTATATPSGASGDDFNRADSTNLGANWTEWFGDLAIVAQTLRNAGTASDNIATFNGGPYGDVAVSAEVQIASGGSGVVALGVRLGNYSGGIPTEGYAVEVDSNGDMVLWRLDTWTELGSYTIPGYQAGNWVTLRLAASGASLSVDVNGVTRITAADSTFASGEVGVWSYEPGAAGQHRFDNFSLELLGTPTATPTATNTVSGPTDTPSPTTTATPTPTATTAGSSRSLEFDGANDIARTVNLPAWTEFTIEAWVQRTADSGEYQTFLSDANSSYSQAMFTLFVDGGTAECGSGDQFAYYQAAGEEVQCSGVNADLDAWYHIAVTRDSSGTRRFFVDGVLRSTATNSTAPGDSSGTFTLGRGGSYTGEYFAGLIDEVRLSNVALYTSTFTPPSTPLTSSASTVGLWHLNEGSGQTIADSSGNGRDGTLGTTSGADSADPTWSTDTPVSGFRGGHVLARPVPPAESAALLDVNALPALQTGGALTIRTITYTYDALHRLTGAAYSDGTEFAYEYDPVGNVLTRTQTIAAVESITTYAYDAANQLETAQTSGESTVWYYAYDNNGSLTEITPNGATPADGARRYTYNAIRQLIRAEQHDGAAYQPQAEMEYNGLGERVRMTGWEGAQSATTVYRLDLTRANRVLAAVTGAQTTYYLYDRSKSIAEFTTAWAYGLADGSGTPRQLTDEAGAVTLAGSYTPWGETLEQAGAGNFAWGYFGGLMDAATGLIYVGGGQYYDPATGRFLTRVNTRGPNPYVPWQSDPLGALLAPVALAALLLRRRKGKLSHADHLLVVVLLVAGLGLGVAACAGTPPPTSPPPATVGPMPTLPPSNTPDDTAPPTTPGQQETTPSVPPSTQNPPPATGTPRLPATPVPPGDCPTPGLTPTPPTNLQEWEKQLLTEVVQSETRNGTYPVEAKSRIAWVYLNRLGSKHDYNAPNMLFATRPPLQSAVGEFWSDPYFLNVYGDWTTKNDLQLIELTSNVYDYMDNYSQGKYYANWVDTRNVTSNVINLWQVGGQDPTNGSTYFSAQDSPSADVPGQTIEQRFADIRERFEGRARNDEHFAYSLYGPFNDIDGTLTMIVTANDACAQNASCPIR